MGPAGRDAHGGRNLSRRLGVVGPGVRGDAACGRDGRHGDPRRRDRARARSGVSGRDGEDDAARATVARRHAAARLGLRRSVVVLSRARYAGPLFMLVGDAGLFIDPLSSFGVKEGARLGVARRNRRAHATRGTRSAKPSACDFFSNWERRVYADASPPVARFRARRVRGTRVRVLGRPYRRGARRPGRPWSG